MARFSARPGALPAVIGWRTASSEGRETRGRRRGAVRGPRRSAAGPGDARKGAPRRREIPDADRSGQRHDFEEGILPPPQELIAVSMNLICATEVEFAKT